ncbi:MAG: glycosyltransferase family 4 protein [Anaerolineales bacterium]
MTFSGSTRAYGIGKGVSSFDGRLGLQQRVLPGYRVAFFDLLADVCRGGLSVFAGEPRADEIIRNAAELNVAEWTRADNRYLLGGRWYLLWQKGLLDWLESVDPEVLILEANPRYLSNRTALRWMQNRGRPTIGWALGAPAAEGLLAPVRRYLRRRYLFQFDALIAYSSQGASEYQALGIPESRIFTAYNAVAPAPGSMPDRDSFEGREPRILFVGRLQERKRVDMLLEACRSLDQGIELTVVGDGPAKDELVRQAAEIFPQANFVGALYGEDLETWFSWADLFVLPGTGGLAVQQAMAAGLPVIVAQGDGTQTDLVSGDNGWLVKPGDQEQLTSTLRNALSQPRALLMMGKESYKLSADRFNIEMMVTVFIKAIESVWKA